MMVMETDPFGNVRIGPFDGTDAGDKALRTALKPSMEAMP